MLKFQKIGTDDYEIIKEQLVKSFNLKNFDSIIAPFEIILAIGNWKEVLLVTNDLLHVFEQLKKNRNPYTMGIHFGDITKKKFKISLEGMTLIAKNVEEKTVLNESGEKKVLYQRDLNKEDVLRIPAHVKKSDLSILVNENEEALALGKYLYGRERISLLNDEQKILKNIKDKGWYLRKGK